VSKRNAVSPRYMGPGRLPNMCATRHAHPANLYLIVLIIFGIHVVYRRRDSAVAITTGYGPNDSHSSSPNRVKNFLRSIHTCCGTNPSSYSMGTGGLCPPGLSGRGVKQTTHLQLVLRSRKCRSILPLPHTPSWRSA
jgi:hypothetical protein